MIIANTVGTEIIKFIGKVTKIWKEKNHADLEKKELQELAEQYNKFKGYIEWELNEINKCLETYDSTRQKKQFGEYYAQRRV
jgi:hypothetical protein